MRPILRFCGAYSGKALATADGRPSGGRWPGRSKDAIKGGEQIRSAKGLLQNRCGACHGGVGSHPGHDKHGNARPVHTIDQMEALFPLKVDVHDGKLGGAFDQEALSVAAACDRAHNRHPDLLKRGLNSPSNDIAILDDEHPQPAQGRRLGFPGYCASVTDWAPYRLAPLPICTWAAVRCGSPRARFAMIPAGQRT